MENIFQDQKFYEQCFSFYEAEYELDDWKLDDKVTDTLHNVMKQSQDPILAPKFEWNGLQNKIDDSLKVYYDSELQEFDELMSNKDKINFDESNQFDDDLLNKNICFKIDMDPVPSVSNPVTKISSNEGTCKLDKSISLNDNIENDQEKTKQENCEEVKSKSKNQDTTINESLIPIKNMTKKKKRSSGYQRWGYEEDVKLFKTLRQLCADQNINMEDFCNNGVKMSKKYEKVIKELKCKVKWKRRTSGMMKRIEAMATNQSISMRQYHLLRKLNTKARLANLPLDIETVADRFPGKSISTLEAALEDLNNKLIFR